MNLKQEKYRRGSHDGEKLSKIIVLYIKVTVDWSKCCRGILCSSRMFLLPFVVDDENTEASADVECQGLMVGTYMHLRGKLVCIL